MVKQKPKIVVSETNKLFLDGCKIHNRETYDDIITRMRTGQFNNEQIAKIKKRWSQ